MRHYNKDFRSTMRAKMDKRQWTVAELSRRTGIPYSTIDTLLKSSGEIHYSRAMAINDALAGKKRVQDTDQD
jgi:predicted transcriptional regulator